METPTPTSSSSGRTRARRIHKRVVEEPWRVMKLIWQSLCAALLPIRLRDIPTALDRYLQHLGRSSDGTRERRAAVFLRNLQQDTG